MREQERERESKEENLKRIQEKQGLEAGVFNVPLLLTYKKLIHNLRLVLSKRHCSYTKGRRTMVCCTSHWTVAITGVGASIGSVLTTTERQTHSASWGDHTICTYVCSITTMGCDIVVKLW
jgi:hypothetical protein